MSETMAGRDYYIEHGYDELPDAVRKEMRRVFDTGVNNSGVWVRFREVENLAGVMAYEYTNKPSAEPETIRCKDCMYYHPSFREIWSKFGTVQTEKNGFCYMAERREE